MDRPESDVPIDPALASSRATGGDHTHLSGDRGSVTGTGDTGEFVGQIAGDDVGYAGETGAERRSEAGESTAAAPQDPDGATRRRPAAEGMETLVHEPVGVTVTGVSLRDPAPGLTDGVRDLLAEHGVVVFPEQHIDDGAFVEFLRGFGDLAFTVGETPVPGFPDLNLVSNVGRAVPPRSTFHVDTSYVRRPPAYTSLRAVEIPARGGETLFTNQYRAYDSLPVELRERLDGRTVTHVVTGVDPGDGAETAAEHPVFRRHPVSGRIALYLSTPTRCVAISGMTPEESTETVAELFVHSTTEDNVYRHAWSPGDVVIWDNACVLHRADHDGVVGDRVMHRGMIAGTDVPAAV